MKLEWPFSGTFPPPHKTAQNTVSVQFVLLKFKLEILTRIYAVKTQKHSI